MTVSFTFPNKSEASGNSNVRRASIVSVALYKALIPSLRAACPDFPYVEQSSTSNPFSQTAGCIPVGSPTTAKSIVGSCSRALTIPFCPETSSSADAKKTRL